LSSNADGSKLVSLERALSVVSTGAHVALGGMMLYRRPVAACRQLASAAVTNLTVTGFAAGIEVELLVSSGTLSTLRTCYAGMEYFGPAPEIRRAVEAGRLRFIDETELTLAAGLQAAAMHVPWLPVTGALSGTDYERVRSDLVQVEVGGQALLGLPALRPDVFIAHVPYADPHGDAVIKSALALDREFAVASNHVIVTAEEIVTNARLRELGSFDLMSFQVDAVVEAPQGAQPTSCHPHYPYDAGALLDYMESVA
jgi:glutaconate CoA-transferase subunit A